MLESNFALVGDDGAKNVDEIEAQLQKESEHMFTLWSVLVSFPARNFFPLPFYQLSSGQTFSCLSFVAFMTGAW